MHIDPVIPIFVISIFSILSVAIIMRYLKQPHIIVYLITGIILGPYGFNVLDDHATASRMGSFGVIFLLFFLGMEVNVQSLAKQWIVSVLGTLFQVIASVSAVYIVGMWFDWALAKTVLLGFVISLSSTAVVIKLLDDWKETNSKIGQSVIGILLVQDIIIVPMLIILGLLDGSTPNIKTVLLQLIGGVSVIGIVIYIIRKGTIHIPILKHITRDHEMQVFTSLGICFALALFTGVTELSAALGAFVAGLIISAAKETHWVHSSLHPIRTLSIAIFFVSIGMLIQLTFLLQYWPQLTLLVLATYLTNTLINAMILRMQGESYKASIYGAALLSQIGEFSFIIALVGYQAKIITNNAYQLTISVIALTLLFSPLWVNMARRYYKSSYSSMAH